jgi:hypothetical protein
MNLEPMEASMSEKVAGKLKLPVEAVHTWLEANYKKPMAGSIDNNHPNLYLYIAQYESL